MKKSLYHRSKRMLRGLVLLQVCLVLFGIELGWAGEVSFLDKVKTVDQPFDSRSVSQVRPIVQPTVLVKEESQGGSFRVLARKQEIERWQCSSCHTGKEVRGKAAFALTHGDVMINHGQEGNALGCIDCHDQEHLDFLEDKKGRQIDFDHSYQLCGQCHFRQKRDWLGGAHGKRVSYWAGDRVVFNCTTCHNPHAPKFAKRFPATYSVPLNR